MLAVELDRMVVSPAVEAKGSPWSSSYAITLMIIFGGILAIQQRGSMSKSPRLYGKMDLQQGHTSQKTSFSTRKSSQQLIYWMPLMKNTSNTEVLPAFIVQSTSQRRVGVKECMSITQRVSESGFHHCQSHFTTYQTAMLYE